MHTLVRVGKAVTWLGEEVDEGVCLTAFVEFRQLRAAVQTEVMNTQPPLSTDGSVEQSTLGNRENKLTRVALASKLIPTASHQNGSMRTQMYLSSQEKIPCIKQHVINDAIKQIWTVMSNLTCDHVFKFSFCISDSLVIISVSYVKPDLHHSSRLLAECVVMFKLDRHGFVTVHCCHFHICSVVHAYGTKEICRPEALKDEDHAEVTKSTLPFKRLEYDFLCSRLCLFYQTDIH